MRRALLFAPYFLPRRRVGSMRPFRFAIHLREMGWEPVVLTIATPNQELTEKEAELLQGIPILEIASPLDRTVRSESQLGLKQKRITPASRMLRELDRQFPVDTWLLLFLLRYRKMIRMVREVRPDVIWTTGDPWSALVITSRIAAKLGIPWAADFRDPWTLSELPRHHRRPLGRPIDRYFEKRVIETADVVIFQTRSVEQAYHARYADVGFESRTITNSFDLAVFDDPPQAAGTGATVSPGPNLTIGFFGRFREASPATILIDALGEVRRRDPLAAGRIRIHSFGPLNAADAEHAAKTEVGPCFVQENAVPLEKALTVLRKFDILVVSTDFRREKIIPAKLFDYLPTGRPILSLSKNDEVEEILGTTGTGIQINPDEIGQVADVLMACLEAKENDRPLPMRFNPNSDEIARFDARRTTEELVEVFERLSLRRGRGADGG